MGILINGWVTGIKPDGNVQPKLSTSLFSNEVISAEKFKTLKKRVKNGDLSSNELTDHKIILSMKIIGQDLDGETEPQILFVA